MFMKLLILIVLLAPFQAVAATRDSALDGQQDGLNAPVFPELTQSDAVPRAVDNLNQLELNINSIYRVRQRIWNKVRVCENCHAENMHSGNRYLPILQGQNREYLLKKLQTFRWDKKSYHPFPTYTQSLSDDELVDISLFYASQRSRLNKALVRFGTQTENSISPQILAIDPCLSCHGQEGNGSQVIPVLSGQNPSYLSYRIREIAHNDSRVHRARNELINCSIGEVTIRQSRELANRFAVVVDKAAVARGKAIYQNVCAACHDSGTADAPKLDDMLTASRTLSSGIEQFISDTQRQKSNAPYWVGSALLSANQWNDVVDYIVDRAGLAP